MPLSHFHPVVQRWFRERVGEPSPPQVEGWPRIRSGRHTLIAAGIKPDGTSLWEHALPIGRANRPVEPLAWGQLTGDRPHWIVASADASIHFISPDGKLIDQFNYGAQLGGIAVIRDTDGRDVLLVAGDDGIEALRFE